MCWRKIVHDRYHYEDLAHTRMDLFENLNAGQWFDWIGESFVC